MKRGNKFGNALFGYVAFFIVVAFTVTAAILIYDSLRRALGEDTGVIAVVMLVVCIGVSFICTTLDALRRRLTSERAVEEILEATEQMASGNFKVRLRPRHSFARYDDLDLIMENVNQMAEELSKNEVLKTDFISNVSHEIKTPLAVIQNYATALQNEKLSKEERKTYVETLVGASVRLTALVMNILKLNKLENQRLTPEFETVRIDEQLAQAVFAVEELLDEKHIELDCDIVETEVKSSPSYLELVWNNLISNAVKFTHDGGKIFISVKKINGKAVVKIADTGIGMSEETGRHIFDKFYQGDTSRAKEGNGLGLALVKRVIDVLGGEIKVESELGKGSEFTVTLCGEE